MALSRTSSKPSKGREQVDYGSQRGPGPGARARDEAEWGMSPWQDGYGNPLPWSGPPGQQRGQRAPTYTPDAGNPANAGYWKNASTPEQDAQREAIYAQSASARDAAYGADPRMQAAIQGGDMRGYLAARQRLGQAAQQQRFVDQGGTPETWQTRHSPAQPWPVPGVPQGGGGAPPPQMGGGGRALPPSQNSMFTGYQPSAGPAQASTGQGGLSGATGYASFDAPGGGMGPRWDAFQGGGAQASTGQGGLSGATGYASFDAPSGGMGPRWDAFQGGGAQPGYGSPMASANYAAGAARGFPGGVTPTNPGPIGRPPFGGPPPTTDPGGWFRDPSLPPRQPTPPWMGMPQFQPGTYTGGLPYEQMGGLLGFGYSPYGGYSPQASFSPFMMGGGGFY